MRGVTAELAEDRRMRRISTRTPHAGSDPFNAQANDVAKISTRTPHAGSDRNIMRKFTASINI